MTVFIYGEDNVFIKPLLKELVEDGMRYTEVSPLSNCATGSIAFKPVFDEVNQVWYEGATAEEIEEIKRQEEANRPPVEPNEMEVLKARVDGLENINAGLLLENAGHQIKIQEQEKMNKEQEVTNANLLLEIAMLKGAML